MAIIIKKKVGSSNKTQTLPKHKPFIDKLSIVVTIQEADAYSVFSNIWAQIEDKAVFNEAGYKAKGKYKLAKFLNLGLASRPLFQFDYENKQALKCRIEFNPRKIGLDGFAELQAILVSLMPDGWDGQGDRLTDHWEQEGRQRQNKSKRLEIGCGLVFWLAAITVGLSYCSQPKKTAEERKAPELQSRASSMPATTAQEDNRAGACQNEANAVARQIGAKAERYASDMVGLIHPDLGETTWGCSPAPFLVMFAKPEQSLADFLTAVGSAGQSLLGEERQRVISLADRCVRNAMASANGYSRIEGKIFTLDCGAGRNALNPKVTIEMPTMPSGIPQ